jgi:hypothetical protein
MSFSQRIVLSALSNGNGAHRLDTGQERAYVESPIGQKGDRMATAPQVTQLEKLMGVLSNETTRGEFKADPDGTADKAGVDRKVPRIQDAINYLGGLDVSSLRLIADYNDKFHHLGLTEKTTAGILAKQV